ncbi:hypothetical protein TRVA0_004S00650 [Trichomonascus vanleenenianus]|uniref:uncharacterized protein n=1 Tax=Trichomonascus vanleenenianus TaxID=2268995 RepID=UPI003EC9EE25
MSHDCYTSCNSALEKQTKCINSAGDDLDKCLCGGGTETAALSAVGKYSNSTVSSFKPHTSANFVEDLNTCIKCGQAAWFFYGPILKLGADQCHIHFAPTKRSTGDDEDIGMGLYDMLEMNILPPNTIPTPGVIAAGLGR